MTQVILLECTPKVSYTNTRRFKKGFEKVLGTDSQSNSGGNSPNLWDSTQYPPPQELCENKSEKLQGPHPKIGKLQLHTTTDARKTWQTATA